MKNPQKEKTPSAVSTKDTKLGDYSANPKITLTVPTEGNGLRLDQVLAQLLAEHSRSRLQNWVRAGRVTVGGVVVAEPRHKLWAGENIALTTAPDERAESSTPENIPLRIVYEDAAVIVLEKPVGLVVHPGNGNWRGTLLNALLHHAPQLHQVPRAGIVHRLDKDTSGLMVVAKTLEAQTNLVRQLQARTVKRIYRALVRGIVDKAGIVDAPIGRHPTQRTRMAVVRTGKPARTRYRVVEHFQACTLIECALETGRTHQIRVHMTSIGHPLVGDPVYGGVASRVPHGPLFGHQALHACRLALIHPLSGKAMSWRSSLPDDLAELIDTLRREAFAARDDASGNEEWDEEDEEGVEVFYVCGDEPDNEEPDEQ